MFRKGESYQYQITKNLENNNIDKSVLILLSTYNGEKYLKEQLDSLLTQKGVSVQLLVRDDGSSDSTIEILREYSSSNDNITVLAESNVGCRKSYNNLMSYALSHLPKFDYYAFSDQDDVWDDNKLSYAVGRLENHVQNPLRLYNSSYRVVDEELSFKYQQAFNRKHTLGEALMMINALGCTMVFTDSLMAQTIKIINSEEANSFYMPNHDGWMYLAAITSNAYIYYDTIPHINYRQHGKNVIGAYAASAKNRFKRILESKGTKSQISKILLNTCILKNEKGIRLLTFNAFYRDSIKIKLKLLFSKDMITNSISVNVAYRILIVFNWY